MIYWILLPKAEEGFIELNQCQVNNSWLEATYYIYPWWFVSPQISTFGCGHTYFIDDFQMHTKRYWAQKAGALILGHLAKSTQKLIQLKLGTLKQVALNSC